MLNITLLSLTGASLSSSPFISAPTSFKFRCISHSKILFSKSSASYFSGFASKLRFSGCDFSHFLAPALQISTEKSQFVSQDFTELQYFSDIEDLTVQDCRFSDCHSGATGGFAAIDVKGEVAIANNVFVNCQATSSKGQGGGFLLRPESGTKVVCSRNCFYKCFSGGFGHAMFIGALGSVVTVKETIAVECPVQEKKTACRSSCIVIEQGSLETYNATECKNYGSSGFYLQTKKKSSVKYITIYKCTATVQHLYEIYGDVDTVGTHMHMELNHWNVIQNTMQKANGIVGSYENVEATQSETAFINNGQILRLEAHSGKITFKTSVYNCQLYADDSIDWSDSSNKNTSTPIDLPDAEFNQGCWHEREDDSQTAKTILTILGGVFGALILIGGIAAAAVFLFKWYNKRKYYFKDKGVVDVQSLLENVPIVVI